LLCFADDAVHGVVRGLGEQASDVAGDFAASAEDESRAGGHFVLECMCCDSDGGNVGNVDVRDGFYVTPELLAVLFC
jgi:hypothetical protein